LRVTETRAQLFVVLFSLLCGGCFQPPPPPACMRCGSDDQCLTGQTCIAGLCQSGKGECQGPNTMQCDETCCIDGDCFELKRHMPPDSLALWLDWTSLYESDEKPIWSDRSSHAYSFRSEGTSPMLASTPVLERTLLRFDAGRQYLVLSGDEQLSLDRQDFLMVVAASLSCKPTDTKANQCLVTRFEKDRDEQKGRGLRLCATRASEEPSSIATCSDGGAAPQCITALASGVACNQMQLFTLSRFTAAASSSTSQIELRHNAKTAAQVELDANMPLDGVSPLRIGGRGSNSLIGDVALVALIVGKVSSRERCELEQFVIGQLAAADMATAAEPPDCSAL
jgi:hypothetical protein